MQFSFIIFVMFITLLSSSAARGQSFYNPPHQHDRCMRYDAHHRCVSWERHSMPRVRVRVSGSAPPMVYDPYGPPSGYYDPYGYQPQYYNGQYGYAYQMQTQEVLIAESEAATLARRAWEADRRATEQAARNAQMSAEAQAQAQRAKVQGLQSQLEDTKKKLDASQQQLQEAEEILLMDDQSSQEDE
jgi:hypothetical protein